jgi:hypothetical protein
LPDLVELIMDNKSSDKYLLISTEIDTFSIEENSIEAFLEQKDIPDPLNQYKIRFYEVDSNHKGIEKYLILNINSKYSCISITGIDKKWVEGIFQVINIFIDRKIKQYEEEQKHSEKEKIVVVEIREKKNIEKDEPVANKEAIVSETTLLQKLEHKSPWKKTIAIAAIMTAIASIILIIPVMQDWVHITLDNVIAAAIIITAIAAVIAIIPIMREWLHK